MNEQRKTIYAERMKVLRGEDVHEQMLKYIPDYVLKVVSETVNMEELPEKWDLDVLNQALQQRVYPDECDFEITEQMAEKWDNEYAIEKISKEVIKAYEQKIINIKEETHGQVDYHQVERNELLRTVDRNWIDHIDAMDQLRKGIGLRGYAQQDPVIAYKNEGYDMFEEMVERIQTVTISRLLKGRIVRVEQKPAPSQQAKPIPTAPVAKPEAPKPLTQEAVQEFMTNAQSVNRPKVNKKSVGRNDPCPCGSGKKYKDCCYWNDHK
jgi:preprotein translocase subunit SecA